MNENSFESPINTLDNISAEELREKLKLAKDKLDDLAVRENKSEFYDRELKDSFADAINRFSENKELLMIYLESVEIDYDKAVENFKKYIDFKNNEFGLAKKEVSLISTAINRIEQAKMEKINQQAENKEMEKFNRDKNDLANTLYEMLSEIYAQIPEEARAVGMDEEVALKKYLPQLTFKASEIEEYIGRIEETQLPFQLIAIKKELENRRLLKK